MIKQLPLFAALALPLSVACADEGMWTFNNFPSAKVAQEHGFAPDRAWLDHLRLASLRIAGGCSASIVSAQALVLTNHHCARQCIENVSGLAKKDYNRDGFFARNPADEPRCPGMEMDQLSDIADVTSRVQASTRDVPAEKFNDVQKAAIAAIEKDCATSDEVRCEVVSLYRGGRYDLYKYRRFQDVHLVFAPEDRIAFFGGDPDNFNFPRYDLDVAMLRIYGKDGKPLQGAEHLAWSDGGPREGDLTFVSGNPGGTSRGLTVAELDDERDFRLAPTMVRIAELRGLITEYQHRGAQQRRQSNDLLFGIENALKAFAGRREALADLAFHARLVKDEADFRARVMADPALAAQAGGAWDAIAALVARNKMLRKRYNALERGVIGCELFRTARELVRLADESGKPNGERLREYADARLPQMKADILANHPIHDELEIATLTFALTKIREDLGPDSPFVRRVFGQRSPADIAAAAVKGSRLKDLRTDARGNAVGGYRKQLFDGGKPAVDASRDPMIDLARAFDADARAVRRLVETEVDGPMKRQQELLAKARFAIYGDTAYPDATFTPRLSYGTVKGWLEDGKPVAPFTTIAGAYARASGADPFALPDSWIKAKGRLAMDTPFNLVTDNDVIGGNSGSPMVNAKGEVVGLVFDGNIHSLGGDYGFDPGVNRTVAVDSAVLLEAMDKVYGARRLVEELTASPAR
ncbi:MAG: S46 family peptidase [Burkholderiaceae bacterium]